MATLPSNSPMETNMKEWLKMVFSTEKENICGKMASSMKEISTEILLLALGASSGKMEVYMREKC